MTDLEKMLSSSNVRKPENETRNAARTIPIAPETKRLSSSVTVRKSLQT